MKDNKNREYRNRRREKQKQRDKALKRVSDDWEAYANKELLDIGEDYDFIEYEEDEYYPRDFS